jgi:oligopeptide transport system substrate-binding protein
LFTRRKRMNAPKKSRRPGWLLLTLLMALALLASACGAPTAEPTSEPVGVETQTGPDTAPLNVLRLQLPEPTSLDPPFYFVGTQTTAYVLRHLFDGLTLTDLETGEALPGVAETWEVSEDGLTWTFHLRSGSLWSDGTEVTAQDFEYAWKRNIDPETAIEALWVMEPIAGATDIMYEGTDPDTLGIEALDDYTLTITTVEPMSYLPQYVTMATFWPLPRWAIEEHGGAWIEAENIVVNGPYLVERWEHDRELDLIRNPTYWGEPAAIDRVEIQLATGTPFMAYQEGEIDVTEVGIADVPVVEADPTLSAQLVHVLYKWLFFLQLDGRHPPFDDLRVRQAFYLAIDREVISNDILGGATVPAYTFIPEGTLGQNADARIEGDVATAQALLAEAGYPGGAGFPSVRITLAASQPGTQYYLAVSAIQTMLRENLGVEVELDMMEEAAFWNWRGTLSESEYDIVWSNWAGDIDDPAQWNLAQTDVNPTGFSDAQYDELVGQAALETDPARRADLYQQAEVIGVRGAATIPIYYSSGYWLVNPRVQGMQFEPLWGVMYWRYAHIVE